MSKLEPDKLTVEFREGVTRTAPVIPRRYTLTHSDITGDLFLTIGPDFAFDTINAQRDEVLGEWLSTKEGLQFYVYLHINGEAGETAQTVRNNIFRRELPLALEAIRYGDRDFFETHPEMDQYPIIVYFLSDNLEYNKAEYWGTFEDYDITASGGTDSLPSEMEYHILIDEKTGDMDGDTIPDRISLYGDKLSTSDLINNIVLTFEVSGTSLKSDMITEVNGYNPSLFPGDFTKDGRDDILFRLDLRYNSLSSKDKGKYGASIITLSGDQFDTIFDSDRYNTEYLYLVEYEDFYKVKIQSTMLNRLFFLDISGKGDEYLSRYYDKKAKLIAPVQGKVLGLSSLVPVIGKEKKKYYNLLATQRVIGSTDSDTLGYIQNLLSWNGEQFDSVNMLAAAPGVPIISE